MQSTAPHTVIFFDIGNTNCKIALSINASPLIAYTLATHEQQTADGFGFALLEILRIHNLQPNHIAACIGSSVVPVAAERVNAACQRYFKRPLLLAPEDIPIPLENRYAIPHEVGADRLAGAFAARRLFPQAASIISVDFGTATTFDCVEGNAYLGGLICPGVKTSISALASNTAKLPKISLDVIDTIPQAGRSTATSLSHGFIFGFASMTEGLCNRLAQTMQGPTVIVGTGGFATSIAKVTDIFTAVYPDLLLQGLQILYNEHATKHAALDAN